MLEARNTDSDSGMTPSNGIDRISLTSSTDSISPFLTRSSEYRVSSRCTSTGSILCSARRDFEASIPMIRSLSRTEETSGLVVMMALSAK